MKLIHIFSVFTIFFLDSYNIYTADAKTESEDVNTDFLTNISRNPQSFKRTDVFRVSELGFYPTPEHIHTGLSDTSLSFIKSGNYVYGFYTMKKDDDSQGAYVNYHALILGTTNRDYLMKLHFGELSRGPR